MKNRLNFTIPQHLLKKTSQIFKSGFYKTKIKKKGKHKSDSLIGITLSTSGIRMVECSKSENRISVTSLGGKYFLEDTSQNNIEVINNNLKDCLSRIDFTTEDVNIAVDTPDIKLEFKHMPYIDSKELKKIIDIEIEKGGFNVKDQIVDYAVLGEIEDKEGKKLIVLIVGVPKKYIYQLVSLLEGVSLQPHYIEIAPLALVRLLNFNKELEPKSSYIIVNVEAEELSINLLQGNLFCLNRRIYSLGENAIIKNIADKMGVDFAQAQKVKRKVDLINEANSDSQEKTLGSVNSILEKIAIEIERSIQYFTNKYSAVNVDKIFLTGNDLIKGIDSYISKNINLPVDIIQPFKNFDLPQDKTSQDDDVTKCSYSVAVGLSLRKFIG